MHQNPLCHKGLSTQRDTRNGRTGDGYTIAFLRGVIGGIDDATDRLNLSISGWRAARRAFRRQAFTASPRQQVVHRRREEAVCLAVDALLAEREQLTKLRTRYMHDLAALRRGRRPERAVVLPCIRCGSEAWLWSDTDGCSECTEAAAFGLQVLGRVTR